MPFMGVFWAAVFSFFGGRGVHLRRVAGVRESLPGAIVQLLGVYAWIAAAVWGLVYMPWWGAIVMCALAFAVAMSLAGLLTTLARLPGYLVARLATWACGAAIVTTAWLWITAAGVDVF